MGRKEIKPMKQIDLEPLLKKYDGLWVALTEYTPAYKVICSGEKIEKVYNEAKRKGHKSPIVFKVSKELSHAIL